MEQESVDAVKPVLKQRVKTTHDVTRSGALTNTNLPYEHYQHSSSKKKSKRTNNNINEDLMLLKERKSSRVPS